MDLIQWIDQDGDETQELLVHGGTIDSAGAGFQRPSTFVYAYRDGKYRLIERRKDSSTHIYFTMLDAHEALSQGQLDQALELVERNLSKPTKRIERLSWGDDYESVNDWAYVRITSYTAIEAMLIYGLRSEPDEMHALLNRIEQNYDRHDNPYVQAARCLWQTYQLSGDVVSACHVMQWTVQRYNWLGRLWPQQGYNMEWLALDQLCPLDDKATENAGQE